MYFTSPTIFPLLSSLLIVFNKNLKPIHFTSITFVWPQIYVDYFKQNMLVAWITIIRAEYSLLCTCLWVWIVKSAHRHLLPVHFAFIYQRTIYSVAIIFCPPHVTINITFHMCPNKVCGFYKLRGVKSEYILLVFLGVTESYLVLNDVTITVRA